MKYYDYTYLTRQDMSEEDAKNLQDKLIASITAKSGTVADLPKAYKKRLAYRIKKQDAAYVNTILFQMETAPIEEFKKETGNIVEIMRGLIISYDPEKLKREIRPEIGSEGPKTAEITTSEKPAEINPAVEIKEETKIKEEKPEANKEEEPKKEPVAEETKEETKEEKTAKPKRKTKAKTELRDIEQKLDEILK